MQSSANFDYVGTDFRVFVRAEIGVFLADDGLSDADSETFIQIVFGDEIQKVVIFEINAADVMPNVMRSPNTSRAWIRLAWLRSLSLEVV